LASHKSSKREPLMLLALRVDDRRLLLEVRILRLPQPQTGREVWVGLGIIGEPTSLSGYLAQQLAEIGTEAAGLRALRNPSIKPVAIGKAHIQPHGSAETCRGERSGAAARMSKL
jgi:hypothetical protein